MFWCKNIIIWHLLYWILLILDIYSGVQNKRDRIGHTRTDENLRKYKVKRHTVTEKDQNIIQGKLTNFKEWNKINSWNFIIRSAISSHGLITKIPAINCGILLGSDRGEKKKDTDISEWL